MKKTWTTPHISKIDSIVKVTLGGSGSKTEKIGQLNKNRKPA